MFEIKTGNGDEIFFQGRLDALNSKIAEDFLSKIDSTAVIDFKDLEYISSAGLSVLLKTQKKLGEGGNQLILRNMNGFIKEIFKYAGFDTIFLIK